MHNFLRALTAALNAFTTASHSLLTWIKWQQENEIDKIEDEIDTLAANGSSSSKLRIERLGKRIKRKSEQLSTVHTGNSNTD